MRDWGTTAYALKLVTAGKGVDRNIKTDTKYDTKLFNISLSAYKNWSDASNKK